MKKIKSIKKCNNSKYQIEFMDNTKIKLYDNVILDNNILFKKELTIDDYAKLEEENAKEDVYYQTLKFISKKMRCRKEIEKFLDKYSITIDEKNKIINKLNNNRLINDYAYARAYVQDRFLLSSDGPIKIKDELLSNNIQYEVIESLLSELEEDQIYHKLEKLIQKRIKGNSTKSNYALKQKIVYEMENLGYEDGLINEVLSTTHFNDNNIVISKEYNKLYSKLSNKYEGEELAKQIYYKLRSKGFHDSEINNIKV